MKIPMMRFLTLFLLAVAAAAQNSSELPSAPSAVVQERNKPQPPSPPSPPAVNQPSAQNSSATPGSTSARAPETKPAPAPQNAETAPAAASGGQSTGQAAAPEEPPATTIRTVVNEVNLIFTVIDKHGRFVKDLQANDINLLDDNKPPAKIQDFRSETDLPLRVGLLVDASNSIRDRFTFEQQAAIEFLSQIIRPRKDLAFVLGFDTTPEITQDLTNDTEKLSKGVRMLRPGGGTAMFDAVYGACRDKLLKIHETGPTTTRRAIILVSDGEDNQSRVTREEAIEMAQRAEVIVFAISTNISGTKSRGDKVLERIAEATGGRAFFPFKIEDVANAFSEVQEELRSQYAISYKPADFIADGHYRSIQIAANNKKYKVRARKGYFAPRVEVSSSGGK
jgi:VWFA-related protein